MTPDAPKRAGSSCGRPVEHCAFCDEPDCPAAVCYRCLDVALRQALARPHRRGG